MQAFWRPFSAVMQASAIIQTISGPMPPPPRIIGRRGGSLGRRVRRFSR